MENVQTVEARSLASIVKGGPWVLTGVSGSGKDYLVDKYLKDLDFQALDPIAAKVNGKWVIDVKRIDSKRPHTRVYGYGDNLSDVAKAVKGHYESGAKLKLIIVEPTYELFKQSNAAKAKDASEKAAKATTPNGPESWAATWDAKAQMSEQKFKSYLEGKRKLLIAKIVPDRIYIVVNDLREGDSVKDGWHKV